ncbi:VanZ family protein [Virgibacillus kekensis]|uniref:VanZ family protein n=1 Tax=Virgibacillus kekensis TaxID=202261 RepID=A0ABV9DIN9_9BACI
MHYIYSLPYEFLLLSLIIYTPIRLYLLKRQGRKVSYWRELVYILWLLYLESLLYLTVFPHSDVIRSDWTGVNLIPFDTIEDYIFLFTHGGIFAASVNLIGNIVVFVPIGFLLVLTNRKISFWKVFVIGFLTTLAIEWVQYALSQSGLLARSSDVDDLILNTFGVIAGYILGKIVVYLYVKFLMK